MILYNVIVSKLICRISTVLPPWTKHGLSVLLTAAVPLPTFVERNAGNGEACALHLEDISGRYIYWTDICSEWEGRLQNNISCKISRKRNKRNVAHVFRHIRLMGKGLCYMKWWNQAGMYWKEKRRKDSQNPSEKRLDINWVSRYWSHNRKLKVLINRVRNYAANISPAPVPSITSDLYKTATWLLDDIHIDKYVCFTEQIKRKLWKLYGRWELHGNILKIWANVALPFLIQVDRE